MERIEGTIKQRRSAHSPYYQVATDTKPPAARSLFQFPGPSTLVCLGQMMHVDARNPEQANGENEIQLVTPAHILSHSRFTTTIICSYFSFLSANELLNRVLRRQFRFSFASSEAGIQS